MTVLAKDGSQSKVAYIHCYEAPKSLHKLVAAVLFECQFGLLQLGICSQPFFRCVVLDFQSSSLVAHP